MAKKSYKPGEIVAMLRQVDVLHSQGMTITETTTSFSTTGTISGTGTCIDPVFGSFPMTVTGN